MKGMAQKKLYNTGSKTEWQNDNTLLDDIYIKRLEMFLALSW